MATNEALRPSNRPADAGPLRLRVLCGIAAFAIVAALVLLLGSRTTHEPNRPAAFLSEALGQVQPSAALKRSTGDGTARIRGERLVVESSRGERVALRARLAGPSRWERRANGTWRPTAFGSETITIGTDDPEHFLTVDRRVGRRTWTWELETGLVGRLLPAGGIGFVDPKSHRVAELTIAPVAIFDESGKDVTPDNLRWQLAGGGRTLKLNLNDESLPEPYVIDPAFRANGAIATSAAANTIALAIPGGVLWGDQLLAQIAVLAPTATLDVVPPAGWTLIRNERNTTNVALWTFRKRAAVGEAGPYTFTFQDPTGTNVNKTSRGWTSAYSGIQSSAPIDGSFGNNGGSNRLATVPAVTTTGTNRISVWAVGNSGISGAAQPPINAIASTERRDSVTAAPALETADATEPAAFSNVTVGTGNVLTASAFWAAQVFSLIPDTTAATQVLTVNEATNLAGQFYNSTTKTHYYNTAAGGTFTVGSVPDDVDSGFPSVVFNAVALTGFTHTLVTDTTSPYSSGTYTWTTANTTSPGANRVTITDRNANALNELTITRDVTQPTVFTLNAPTGGTFIKNGSTVSVAAASPTDAGADVADVSFRACPGSNGCVWADADAFAVGSDTTDQYLVAWPIGQADGAYQLIARATDNVGNLRDTAAPVNVTLDNTNPAFGTLAIGAPTNASLTGTTVYFRGSVAGSFTLSQPLTDTGGSGAASVQYPAIATAGWTHANETVTGASPYVSSTFSWTPTPSTPSGYILTGADVVGNTPTRAVTFVNDSAVPISGALTVNGTAATGGSSQSYDIDGTFTIGARTDYADGDSGLASSTLTREDGTLTTDSCVGYSAPAVLVGTPAQNGLATGCYRYVLTGTDNVGNVVSIATVVKVDTTDPTAPTLTPSDASADVHTTGTTAYYRPAGTGSFDVTASSTDDESGVAPYTFPTLAGFTGSGAGATRTYTLATPTEPDGAKTVTANNNAGRTNSSTFTLTADSAVPIGGALTVNGTAATGGGSTSTSSGSFSITRTDYTDAISGIDTSTLTRDSAPFTNDGCGTYSGSPTTLVGTPAQNLTTGCYQYVLTGTDLVGNTTSLTTVVQVHGAATQIALTGSTANLTSGAARVLTATVRDAAGNTVVSDSSTVVAFAKASGAGTVTSTGDSTASSGVATKTVTGQLVGAVTMEATSAGLTTGTLGAFTVVHGAATQITLTGATTDLSSGGTRLLTATLKDAAGNTVTSDSTTEVGFTKASGAGTVTGTGNATVSSGVATKTITGALIGSVTMEATSAGLTTGTLGAFTVVHGAATQITLTGATTDLSSGGTRLLTATLKDAAGNTVTSDSTTEVGFTKASGAGTVTGTGNATVSSGVATKTITGALIGSVTMEATSAGLTTGTLGAFTVVHGAATQITLTGATTDLSSGGTRLLTATLKDAAGNTVTSDSTTEVGFTKASGAGTVTGTGNATVSSGVATKTITGALIGSVTMEATSAGLTTGTLGAFTVVHGAAADIVLTGSTANLTSGTNRVLTATLKDAAGNTVTSDNSTEVAFAKAGGSGTVSGTGNATVSSGVATKTVTGVLDGTVNMEASSSGLTTGTLTFVVVHGAAADIVLTGSTADLTSGTNRVLTATLKDAAGNTVTSDSTTDVSFTKASGAGTVTGTGSSTVSNGVATKAITGQLIGSVTMQATASGLTTGTLGAFTVVHGAAADIVLTGSTADLTSGATRLLTATLKDAAGNTVTSDSTTEIAFAKASGLGTVTGTGNATVSSGVATKTVTGQLVGMVNMEATSSGLTTGTLGFVVVHGAAADIVLTGSTADLTSGTNRVLTATLKDAAGNTVTSDSTTEIAFTKASGAGTVTGTGTVTASAGVATKAITGQLVGSVTMQATSAGLNTGTLGAFTVVHGAAADIVLTGSTSDLTSGTNRVLTATLKDAAGNTVTSDSTTEVAFAKAGGSGTVSGTGNATVSSGVATKTVTGVLDGTVNMEASSSGLTTGTLTFVVVHGAAADIVLTGSTADLTSGTNRVLTATLKDAAGNTVTSDSTTDVSFTKASGAGTVTGTGSSTVSNGVATKAVTGALAGSVTMQATSAGLTTGTLGAFTVVHGAAAQLALSGATANLTSGANRVLTATVQDAAGNTVTSDNSTVVAFGKQSGAGTISGAGNDTAVAGVATKTVTGVLAGAITLEATSSGLATGTLAFTIVHGAATDIALTGATTDLTSGGTRLLTATLKDAAGNTVTSDNTTDVNFTKASGAGTVTGTGTATASSGVATKTLTGQLVGSVTMQATSAGLTTGTLGAFTVVHGAAADIVLTGATTDLTSGATRALTATLKDAAGNTVTSDNSTVVAFTKASGAGTVSGTGNDTAVAGVATKTLTGVLAGSVTMQATSAGLTTGTLGAFTVVHGAAAQLALSGATTNLTSGANRVLTATVQDAAGNTVTSDNSTVVAFGKQSGAGTISGAGNDTAVAGVATKTVTGVLAGAITLEATSSGLATGTLAFTIVHGAATDIALTGATTDLTSGGTRLLTATLKDAAGNTVTSDNTTDVNFTKASGAGTVTGTGTATASSGVATKTLTGQLVGSVTMQATSAGLTTGTLGAFTVVHGAATQIALSGSTANLTSGATRVLTATVQDAAGNTVTSDSTTDVNFTKASGAGTVTGTGTATASSGVATKTVTGQLAGSVTMQATASGLTTGTLGAFTVVHGAAADIVLTGATTDLTSGGTRLLTATLKDAAGNTVTSDNTTDVNFTKASGAGTVTGTGTATASSGVATKTLTGQLAGSVTMQATSAGLTTGTLGAFTVVHGAATQIALTGSSANLTSGATRLLTATLKDAAGNTVTSDSTTEVAFAKAGGAGTVSGTGTATASSGVATKTLTGQLVGSVTMEATSAGLTTGTLGAFTVVHGAAADIVLTGATTDLTSGGTRLLTATLKDAAGNTVTSDSTTDVNFTKASGAGTVTGTGTATASSGVATKTLTGQLAGSVTMQATSAGLTTGTLGAFTVVHGAAADIVLTGATTDLTSGGTRLLTATLKDAAGNTVTSDNSTDVNFTKAAGAGTVTGTGTATASSGVATKTLTGQLVGSVTMEATSGGLTTGTLGAFTVVHGAATQIALSGSTANLTSGATRALTATIQDAAGNTVTSDSTTDVNFTKASGAGTVTGTGTDTAASGVATKTLTGQLAGSVTMQATSAGLTTGTLAAFTVVHGAAADIVLTGATTDLTSGATRALTATLKDAAGNTVTSDNSTVVAFTKASGAGTVSGTGNDTAVAGVATKTLTGVLAGSVTMEATSAGLTTGTLGAFTVVHGAATQIALTGSTANLTSGATRALTATLQDAAGNTVTSDNSTVVAFTKASGAGTVTGTGTATASSGVATKTVTGQLVGSVTMEATSSGLTTGTLGAFTVVHGAATQIALTGSTADLTSGGTRLLTATLQDAAGNTVTSDNSTVVAFTKAAGAGTLTGTGNATVSSGVATKTLTGVLVGSVTMEATSAGLTTGTLGAFTVVHGAAADIVLTGATTDLTSGATRLLTATLQDAAGNTATSDNSTVVAFTKAAGAGTLTGTGNATVSSGVATKTVTGVLVGSVTMEATSSGLTTGTLGAFTVVHGAAAQLALSGSTANLTSGANRVLTATVQDAAGNTVTNDNSTVVAFGKQSGAGTISGAGNDTAVSGVATKTVTGVLVGSVTMEATSSGLTTGTLGAFTVVHGAAAHIVLTGATTDLTSGATRALTATLKDAAGNTVTSDNSTVVAFTKASGAGTLTGTGNATVSSGVATKTVTGVLVGSVTMEATSSGLTTGTLGAFTVVHGAAAQLALSGSTANLTSGANRVLTATVQDAAGNTVTNDNSTVVAFGKQSGAGTISGAGNDTAVSGVATKTVTGVLVGSVTMEASSGGLTTGTLGAFTVVHGAAADIVLTGATTDLTSGAPRALTATLKDAAGNTVTSDNSTVVAFTKASGAGTVSGTGTATASSGVATKTLTGVLVGSVAMEATSSGLTTGTLGAFTVVHGAAADIVLTGATTDLTSGANRVLTATLKDAAGNTVTSDNSTVVAFTKASGAGTLTGTGNATVSSGVATKTVTGQLVGSVTMEATSSGLTTGTLGAFTVVHGAATQIALTGSTADLTSGTNRVLTATLKDAAGNTVTSDNSTVVAFTKAAGAGTVTGTGTATAAGGVATKTVTGQLVGSVSMEATSSGLTTGTLGAFTVVHAVATQIALTGSTADLTSGGTRLLTATLQDAAGNTVTSDNSTVVAFTKASGAGTVTGTGTATAVSGVATKTLTGVLVGSVTMEASSGGLTTGTLGAFTVVHGAATQIALTGATSELTIGSNRVLTATLKDAAGNTVTSDNSTVVAFAKQSGAGNVTGTGNSTAAAGIAQKTVTGQTPGAITIEATTSGLATGTISFIVGDGDAPTNTVTPASAAGAYLSGLTLYYRPSASGSFTLSSAVVDTGAGPGSATYPTLTRTGWTTHNDETVSTPAGGPYVSSSFSWNNVASGDFSYVVTAADAWSPPNTSNTTLNVTEDSTAPAASILCNAGTCPAGWFTSSPVSVTLAAPDAGAGLDQIRYTTDGSDPTILTGTVYAGAFNVAAEGVTTVKYRAFDRIGNDSGVQSQVIRIDTIAPQTTIDVTPAAATPDTTPTFEFSADEAGSAFQYRLNGGSWTLETSPLTLGPLAENTYTFDVRATDVAGNVDASPASFVFTVDTTPADTTLTANPPLMSNSTNASFSFTASDAGPSFECSLDGAAFTSCSSPKAYSGLSEASHTFQVRAKDAAGNVDATPASYTWTVDLTAPITTILTRPTDPYGDPIAHFTFESNEPGSTFRCRVDGGSWSACSSPYDTSSLADGAHTFEVEATDAAGNADATPDSDGWVTDDTNPTGSVTAPANGVAVSGTAVALASNSADSGSGVATVVFQRSPAGAGTWTNQATPWNTTLQTDGEYDLRVLTTDNAGNSFTSGLITVTVDNTAPTLTVNVDTIINIASPDPETIGATATDAGTGVANVQFDQCVEDSVLCDTDSWILLGIDTGAPYEASWAIPSDGPRLLRVRATDGAGRQATETVLVTIDRTRPSGTVTAPVAAANLRGASVALAATGTDPAPASGVNTVTFQRSPAGAGTWTPISTDSSAPYTGTFDTTAVTDGLYDLRVFTTDVAGNAEATPATTQVRVDNTLPTGEVTAPVAAANLRGTVTFTSNSADPLVSGSASGVADPPTGVAFERRRQGESTWTAVTGSSWVTSASDDGVWETRVTTTDKAGNAFTSAIVSFRVDNTAPTGSVTGPTADANLRGTIALTSDSADPNFPDSSGVDTVVFERRTEGSGGGWTVTPASWATTAADDGRWELRVTTTDVAGNSFTSPVAVFRVDNTAPTGSVTAPATGTEIGVPSVTLTSTDAADPGTAAQSSGIQSVVFERSPAGANTWTATNATWNTASGPDAVGDGSYDLRVKITDNAGNVFDSAAITVLVDHTAPTTSATVSPGNLSNAPVTVSFTANDGSGSGVSTTKCFIDNVEDPACTVEAPGDHSNDGSHIVRYFSTDDVGNVETPKTETIVIDTTAPAGSPGNPGDYLRGTTRLTYSSSDTDISSVQFEFSPAGMNAWASIGALIIAPPYEVDWNTESGVADGAYDLRVIVTDSAANVSTNNLPGLPKYVDNTDPTGTMSGPGAGVYVSGTAVAVTASAGDGATPPASGVAAVRFEVKASGAGSFSSFGSETAPVIGSTYRRDLDTTSYPDGPAELRVVVTDVAGNETTSATRTVNFDNQAPTVTLNDPGAGLSGSVVLGATAAADTVSVAFERRAAGAVPWTPIGTDNDGSDGFSTTFGTTSLADGNYELRAVATDGGANVGSSAPRSVSIDNTNPTGSITAPGASDTVGGPAVQLAADAADSGSGVASVDFLVKVFGSGSFVSVGVDTSAPYALTWDSTPSPDGAAQIRADVRDVAGNVRQTAGVPVTVDSTGPSVSLANPGAILSGTASLSATTGGSAVRVSFGISAAGAGTWSELANDTTAPFGTPLDTRAYADGVYDLRATGYDVFGNPSTTPSVRANIRFDNVAPTLVSSNPADGSIVTSMSSLALTASEPVTITGALLDGSAPPAPTVSGNTITYTTGALNDGIHVLSGTLRDASGTETPFRVAVTVESTPSDNPPPIERSITSSGNWTLTVPGGLVTVKMPQSAWPDPPTPQDYILVLRVDAGAATVAAAGSGFAPGTQMIEITARWAYAGTYVTEFKAPLEIVFSNPNNVPAIPAWSPSLTSAWNNMRTVEGSTLPSTRRDGFYRDSAGVHVLTRHLTFFGLRLDDEAPTAPRDVAGVVADDGLTVRWIPGTDNSGELGNTVLYVNGEAYQDFSASQFEAKLGQFAADDTRTFTLAQYDAAGNVSPRTQNLRAVPRVVGKGLAQATAALVAAGFRVGQIREEPLATVAPGTVIAPTDLRLALESSSIDLVIARGGSATTPQTRLVFSVAGSKKLTLQKTKSTSIPARIKVSRPADVTATLYTAKKQRLYTWRLKVKAGANVVKLPLPAQIRRPGTYSLTWVARSGTETIRRTVKVTLVGPKLAQVKPKREEIEVVLAGEQPAKDALQPGLSGTGTRVVATTATPDQTFDLAASAARNVGVVVVDVDAYGLGFISDLRIVFPSLRMIAIAREPATRTLAIRAGAVLALPRNTPAKQLAKAIAAVAGR